MITVTLITGRTLQKGLIFALLSNLFKNLNLSKTDCTLDYLCIHLIIFIHFPMFLQISSEKIYILQLLNNNILFSTNFQFPYYLLRSAMHNLQFLKITCFNFCFLKNISQRNLFSSYPVRTIFIYLNQNNLSSSHSDFHRVIFCNNVQTNLANCFCRLKNYVYTSILKNVSLCFTYIHCCIFNCLNMITLNMYCCHIFKHKYEFCVIDIIYHQP